MNLLTRKTLALSLAAATVFTAGVVWNGKAALEEGFSSSAEARVGRPLTPISYAGVARRTTRRAVAVGAAGAAAYGAYAAPGCAQVVDAYGRIVTQCN